MIYHIPYALFIPHKNPGGSLVVGTDGYGNPTDGAKQPLFDTLLAFYNPNAVDVRFYITVYDQNGNVISWPTSSPIVNAVKSYTLKAGHHLSTTFIKGNIFPDPIPEFIGYLTITTPEPLVIQCIIGGGGVGPGNWNGYSAVVPVYCDTQTFLNQRLLETQATEYLAYNIQFQDANHNQAQAAKLGLKDFSYCTGLVLTNIDYMNVVYAHIDFVVGDTYPLEGQIFSTVVRLEPRQQIVRDLLTEFMPTFPKANAEGTVIINLRQTEDPSSPLKPDFLIALSIAQNRGYDSFSAVCAYQ